jgi:integrase/recombinase XerD
LENEQVWSSRNGDLSRGKTMASLYRKPVFLNDPKTGEKLKSRSKKWWGRFRENGTERRVPLAADKGAAQAMLNELVRKVERRAAGLGDPFEDHQKRPLQAHLDDFAAYLANKGSTPDYVNTTKQRVRSVIEACKFVLIDDLSSSRIQEYLAQLRGKNKSIASSNHYLRAIKMFSRWLVRDRRTADDRLAHLSKMNTETDRRRIRRPLTMQEFQMLLESAESGPSIQNISGPDRAVLYIVGAYTGFRRKEIASIYPHSFDFDSEPPILTIEAAYSKHRRTDVIPLRRDFAERIRVWITSKGGSGHGGPLFDMAEKRTAEMIKKDLERVGIPYVNERGHYADFHALRKTFITNLSRAGVPPKTTQMLARHSDINLTMNVYTALGMLDQAAAVEALPAIPYDHRGDEAEVLQATGTEGTNDKNGHQKVPTVVPSGAENGAILPASSALQIAPDCTEMANGHGSTNGPRDPKNSEGNGACCATLHQQESNCTEECARGESNSHPFRDWILSPARLPIPPLALLDELYTNGARFLNHRKENADEEGVRICFD